MNLSWIEKFLRLEKKRPSELAAEYKINGNPRTLAIVKKAIDRWDPIEIGGLSADEYDVESAMIAQSISAKDDLDEVNAVIFAVFRKEFGADAVCFDDCKVAALEIWTAMRTPDTPPPQPWKPDPNKEMILCKVTFAESSREYSFLSYDLTICAGDMARVEVGHDNRKAIVTVVSVEPYSKEKLPVPLDRMKRLAYITGTATGLVDCPICKRIIEEDSCNEICEHIDCDSELLLPRCIKHEPSEAEEKICRLCKYHMMCEN